jgi:hypothetical protein
MPNNEYKILFREELKLILGLGLGSWQKKN